MTDNTSESTSEDHTQASDEPPADDGAASARAYLTALAVANGQNPPAEDDIDEATLTAIGDRLSGDQPMAGASGQRTSPSPTATGANTPRNRAGYGAGTGNRMATNNPAQPATTGGFPGSRTGMGGPGNQHGMQRDTWDVLGYPEQGDVDAEDYIQRSKRQDPAYIVCNKPVEASWKLQPQLIDASHETEAEDQTQFESDISALLNAENDLLRGLLHYLEWGDREQRPGQYGLLFLGLDDGAEKSEPVNIDEISGPEDVKYIRPFNQDNVESWTLAGELSDSEQREYTPPWADDGEDDYFFRPDMPVEYEVQFTGVAADGSEEEADSEPIHWTRVVHIVERPTNSEFLGMSCLEPILNRLIDFEKVLGASAEMYWTGADRKYFLSAAGDQNLVDDDDIQWLDEQFRMMAHNMRQAVFTQNMDFEALDGQAVDPSGIIDALYQSMAGVSGLPQRVMTGSERGDLASSMDQATWFGRVHERQQQFCEPSILRPVIDRFISYGAVAEPEGIEETEEAGEETRYRVEWPSLFELTDQEKAKLGLTIAQTFKELENAIALGTPRDLAYAEAGYEFPDDMLDDDGFSEYDDVGEDPEEGDGVDRGSVPDADRTDPEESTGAPGSEPSGDPGGREDEDEGERVDEMNRQAGRPPFAPESWSPHDVMARAALDGGHADHEDDE